MTRAVLISIRPGWTELIACGDKTLEIRKTRPNLGTPFKCYIYETQGKSDTPWIDEDGHMIFRGCGKVVAEFTCDRINRITHVGYSGSSEKPVLRSYKADKPTELEPNFDFSATCMSTERIEQYLDGGDGYAWHISGLKIYYTSKELTEFYTWKKCKSCSKSGYENTACTHDENCMIPAVITKAPQNWRYVEDLNNV